MTLGEQPRIESVFDASLQVKRRGEEKIVSIAKENGEHIELKRFKDENQHTS